ncbi:DUF6223 family protein [Streptomyces antarcticus]|uniref:DUF6223 family protein n=1 Tax=Streptomyces antarcticus TaxID=2996458 RepID=UPI00226F34DF|nr:MULTISPECIES: DUF6223 family protein [unclassified Streptomyces]MCY0947645.1 DUF6223 family protein [Streptomyces sp. H34-AA3]MCZ4087715.1 DUF6223 family protein [Streptomyces sp. H34-S5]
MSARRLFAASAAALLAGLALATPAAAHASVQPVPIAAGVTDFSLGRLGATTGGLLGLAALVVAVLALTRPAGRLGIANGSVGATAAVVAGLTATALGALVAATADGGLGTGNGLGGAYVALLLGLAGTALGGRALIRSRRTR